MKKYLIIFTILIGVIAATALFLNTNDLLLAKNYSDNLSVTQQTVTAVPDEVCTGTNLIDNASFEGEYEPYVMPAPGHPDCQTWDLNEPNQYCERVKLATNWHPYWRNSPRTVGWENIQPEYVPSLPHEIPPRVHSGDKSQHYFSFWSTHEAGFYQQQTAVPGGTYCFSIYGHSWSARTELPGFLSDPNDHGFIFQRVGIDPTGGTDWESATIIWGDERMQYDEFGIFSIEATAQASTITVFVYSRPDLPVKHNDVYWDDAYLSLNEALFVDTPSIGLIADDDVPVTISRTIGISVTPTLNWTAVLDPNGTFTPTVSLMSGDSSTTSIDVTIDTTGLALGIYNTTLTLTADSPQATGSPHIIPMKVIIAENVYSVSLPLVTRP